MMLVTVIMPFFKKKFFFKESYYSALNQNMKNLEIIVIYDDDDRSDIPYIRRVINNDKNTTLLINKKNLGAGISRNLAIKKAKGKYIAFLDCDDTWSPNKLTCQINFMMRKKADFAFTSYHLVNSKNKKIVKISLIV